MRFLFVIVTVVISTSLGIKFDDGRPPFIHAGAWIANNDTKPLLSREYRLLVFPAEFDNSVGYGSRITGIAKTSPLQCYDGTDVECAENLNDIYLPSKKASEIITQLM